MIITVHFVPLRPIPQQREVVEVIQRAFSAVLSEVVALIRYLPDQLRLAEVSDPLWRKAVEACGKTVTVASEYDVSKQEAEESGIMDVMPVHRVSMADTEEEKARKRLEDIAQQLKSETEARDQVFSSVGGHLSHDGLLILLGIGFQVDMLEGGFPCPDGDDCNGVFIEGINDDLTGGVCPLPEAGIVPFEFCGGTESRFGMRCRVFQD